MKNYNQQWQDYLTLLSRWRKQHPAFAPQLYKVQKQIEKMHVQCMKLVYESEYKKKPYLLIEADAILESAEREITRLKRLEFLASLSK
jgi:hypothetical protein